MILHCASKLCNYTLSQLQPIFLRSCRYQVSLPSNVLKFSTVVRDSVVTLESKTPVTLAKEVSVPVEREPINPRNEDNVWCASMDLLLKEGVEKYTNKEGLIYWDNVVQHVGYGMDHGKCVRRWNHFLEHRTSLPETQQSKWTESEISLLLQLEEEHRAIMEDKFRWAPIAKELNRTSAQCKNKWARLKYELKGQFTPEEDALILQAVKDWEKHKGPGLWSRLSRQLQRNDSTVRGRYRTLVVPRLASNGVGRVTYWNDQMDAALTEFKRSAPDANWADVAARLNELGYEVNSKHCFNRWNIFLKGRLQGQRSKLHLTPEEAAELLHLRDELGLGWQEIGQKMNIVPHVCSTKYQYEKQKHLKRGVFTEEEDDCIVQAVKEWGNAGNGSSRSGLWVNLEKKMLRPRSTLKQRWAHLLTHHVGKSKLGER